MCILALCSLVDYGTWTLRLLIPADKLRFIKRHLDIYNYYSPSSQQQQSNNNDFEYIDIEKEKKLMKEFTFNYLKDDGIFAMRIMASSASDLIVTEIISELWKNFRNNMCETTDDTLLVTSPSSTSSSSTSSTASTPTQQLGKKTQSEQPDSPTNIIKKPFNYNGNIKVQYSPTTQQQQNQNSAIYSNSALINQKQQNQPNNLNSTEFVHPPPVPTTIMPQLSNTSENEILKKPLINTKDNNIFPHIQPQQQRINMHHELHSNVNPNSKDTHV